MGRDQHRPSSSFTRPYRFMSELNIPLKIELHANQQHIQDHAKTFNVIKAGKRFGKTKLAIFRALQKAGRLPGGTVWYLSPTYRQSKQIAWWELMRILPPQLIKRKIETDLFVELFNECRFQLVGADNEDSLRGPKLDHLVMDEAAYCKDYIWDSILHGQLLGNESKGTADFISSPNKTGRNWFSTFHEDAMAKQKNGDEDWAAFYFTIYDNPTLPKVDIDKLKADIPDDTWNLEYMAIESLHAGQKYSEFQYDTHVKQFANPERLLAYRAIDWGLDHPTVCLWARVDKANGIVHIYDEFVKSGLIIEEIVRVVNDKTASQTIEWTVIDPSANRRDQVTNRSVKDEFSRCGMGCVDGDRRGADNVGGRGVDIVKMFFKKNMIRIDPRCKNLILELRNLQWGDKTGDDCCDALRYLLVRLHDLVFNGVLNKGPDEKERDPRVFNINDPILFPKREMEYSSSIRQELNAY